MTRPTTRLEQQRHLHAITKRIVRGAYPAERFAQLLDMHLTRDGLCVVTLAEKALIPHPTAVHDDEPLETS